MYEVRVECDFSAAHFLRDYSGKCERLHGHNYKVRAYVKGHVLGECGMLLDFATLKHALANVCGTLEHTNLNDMPVFLQNPSAERIAQCACLHIHASTHFTGTNGSVCKCN